MGLYSILNEVYFGVYFKITDFEREIGMEKTQFDSFLRFLLHDVIEKMQQGSPVELIYNRRKDIVKKINFNRDSLKKELLTSPIRKECILKFKISQVFFLLMSSKKRSNIFSIIQVFAGNQSDFSSFYSKSEVHLIRHEDLLWLVCYLELALESAFNTEDLKTFYVKLFPSRGNHFLEFQALSNLIESEEQPHLQLKIKIYLTNPEDNEKKCIEIEENALAKNIKFFTLSIREFLSQLPKKDT
jgi:hypothetical protein